MSEDIKLTREQFITLTFPQAWRAPVWAKQIGRGRWTTAFREYISPDEPSPRVWLLTRETQYGTDYQKEMLAAMDRRPHLPRIEFVGYIGDARLYETDFYNRLTAKSGEAWKQFRTLQKIAEDVNVQMVNSRAGRIEQLGNEAQERVIEQARAAELPVELCDALEALRNGCANYGQTWWFEFCARNLAVDDKGRLVLLDCVFNREQIARQMADQRKRSERR